MFLGRYHMQQNSVRLLSTRKGSQFYPTSECSFSSVSSSCGFGDKQKRTHTDMEINGPTRNQNEFHKKKKINNKNKKFPVTSPHHLQTPYLRPHNRKTMMTWPGKHDTVKK